MRDQLEGSNLAPQDGAGRREIGGCRSVVLWLAQAARRVGLALWP